jgi:hypothetical protein
VNVLTRLKFWKRKGPPTHTWEFSPYPFEKGRVYVMELAISEIEIPEVDELQRYFEHHGINCKLVLTRTGRGVHPVTYKRMTQEIRADR